MNFYSPEADSIGVLRHAGNFIKFQIGRCHGGRGLRKLVSLGIILMLLVPSGVEVSTDEQFVSHTTSSISSDVRLIVYILPSKLSMPYWQERFGDRIYFYVYSNLESYAGFIDEDFRVLSKVYNTVIILIPAEDSDSFYRNLQTLDFLAEKHGIKILWAILPKWKYGREEDYLIPGSAMNRVVLQLMNYLASLKSTWRIAIWYGWTYKLNADDIVSFYAGLPDSLKSLYSCWIDQPFIEVAVSLARKNVEFLVITELYDTDAIARYSGLFKNQLIVTGYHGAKSPEEWLKGIHEKIMHIKGDNRLIGIWIFYDIDDGHGEEYAAFRPSWGAIPDPYNLDIKPVENILPECHDSHIFRVLVLFYSTELQSLSRRTIEKVVERLPRLGSFFWENTGVVDIRYDYVVMNRSIFRGRMASEVVDGRLVYWVEPSTVKEDVEALGEDLSSYAAIIVYYGIRWPYVAHGGISYGAKGFFGKTGFISIPIAPDREPISDNYADFLIEVAVHEFLHIVDDMYEILGDPSFYSPDEMSKRTNYTVYYDYYKWMLRTWPSKKWFLSFYGYNAKKCNEDVYVYVGVRTNIGECKVRINNTILRAPGSLWISPGTYKFLAEPPKTFLGENTTINYTFEKWMTGSMSSALNPAFLPVDRPTIITADFTARRAYRVIVKARYSQSLDSWILEGTNVTLAEPAERVEGEVKYVFKGWYSEGKLISREPSLHITVNSPLRLESLWEKYFYVKIVCSPPGVSDVCGTGMWLQENTTLSSSSFPLEKVVSRGNVRYVLSNWSLNQTVRVVSPLTLTANYGVQYRVVVNPGPGRAWVEGGEWHNEDATVVVKVESTRFGFPIQNVLTGFDVVGGQIEDMNISSGWVRIKVKGPLQVNVLWREDYSILYTLMSITLSAPALYMLKRGSKRFSRH